jgi:hypothetical protein
MTLREHYQKAKTWQRKCIVISYYHNAMVLKSKSKWKVRNTAHYFGISMGKVSEDLNLFRNIDKLKDHYKRQSALAELRTKL